MKAKTVCTLTQKSKLEIPIEWIREKIVETFEGVPEDSVIGLLQKNPPSGEDPHFYLSELTEISVTWREKSEVEG